jgi:hypothetical protein
MYDNNPSPSRHVTPHNCGQPLQDRRPDTLVHPFLSDVKLTLHAHEICGIVDAIGTDTVSASDNNRKKFLQSNRLIESNPAASPAAGNASEAVTS